MQSSTWKNTMHAPQTAAEPPYQGSAKRAVIGWIWKSRNAASEIAAAARILVIFDPTSSQRASKLDRSGRFGRSCAAMTGSDRSGFGSDRKRLRGCFLLFRRVAK